MNIAVIICAAGNSKRFVEGQKHNLEAAKKKQFADVAGRPAFLRSVELFADRENVKQIILSIPAEDEEMFKITHEANLSFHGVKMCLGGAERFETVAKALELVKDEIDFVAVHDAVRCCLTEKWVDDVFKAAEKTGAAMLACPIVATLKKVKDGQITETVDRTGLYEAQTPQVFRKDLLKKAYANLGSLDKSKVSDDSQLVEALGQKVAIVETDSSNIKITTKADIAIAEAIIKSRLKSKPKGYVGPYGDAQW
ncbi:MAG: 2-C-methyl-D-erythritol 4-phosphate cytidylyltransferase [Planctomycetes bacterium HGW-Planctomycetes-1]|nr:MAG: 2-C-methyl-D-erythritol 4-phosphate cytidylyltransferase [Planctomycetes bacterium HGW-Planctomycetes-1]